MTNKHAVFSFFSGAGFLDLGFEDAGFDITFINEININFLDAYKHSRKELNRDLPKFGFHQTSIDDFLDGKSKVQLQEYMKSAKKEFRSVGFIGGPPCPDFSVGGKNKGSDGDNGKLSSSYISTIINNMPDWFLFENVRGLWRTKKHRAFYEQLKNRLELAGYEITERLVNSLEFGVPQDRYRILMFGVKKTNADATFVSQFNWVKNMTYPDKEAFNFAWPKTSKFGGKPRKPNVPEELTVNWWFKKNAVEKHPNGKDFFIPRAGLAKFEVIEEGDDKKKSYKRLHRWRYSPTAAYGNNEVHLHPWLPRRISAAEALAIQSLPATFNLPRTMTLSAMFKTIGNGVPYLLSHGIAKTILEFIARE